MVNISLNKKRKLYITVFTLLIFLFSNVISLFFAYCQDGETANEIPLLEQDDYKTDLKEKNEQTLKGYVSKIPSGTKINLILETPIDEITSRIDDEITAKTSEDVIIDGNTVVSAGSTVVGKISEINPAKRLHKSGSIRIEFKNLALSDGRQIPIVANVLTRSGLIKGKYTKKTALISGATIVAPAAAGFGAGLAAEGSPVGGTIGAALGLLAGVALFAFQRGNMIDIKAGDELEIELVEEALLPKADHEKIMKLEEDLNKLEKETGKIESFETKPVEIDFIENEKNPAEKPNQEEDSGADEILNKGNN